MEKEDVKEYTKKELYPSYPIFMSLPFISRWQRQDRRRKGGGVMSPDNIASSNNNNNNHRLSPFERIETMHPASSARRNKKLFAALQETTSVSPKPTTTTTTSSLSSTIGGGGGCSSTAMFLPDDGSSTQRTSESTLASSFSTSQRSNGQYNMYGSPTGTAHHHDNIKNNGGCNSIILVEKHYGAEHGVLGMEQADESYFDDRSSCDGDDNESEDDDDEDYRGADGRIKFSSKKLYGRSKELNQCHELYMDALDGYNKPGIVFVSGYSGCGKSSLIEEFVKKQSSKNNADDDDKVKKPLYLSAKHEAIQVSTPLSALRSLFDNDDSIALFGDEEFANLKSKLYDALGDDAKILPSIFPGLRKFCCSSSSNNSNSSNNIATTGGGGGSTTSSIGDNDSNEDDRHHQHHYEDDTSSAGSAISITVSLNNDEQDECPCMSTTNTNTTNRNSSNSNNKKKKPTISRKRLLFAIQSLLKAFTEHRPLILFVDDVQWADEQSLELLESLLLKTNDSPTTISNLFVFAAYRSNEVTDDHPLSKMMDRIETQKQQEEVLMEKIELKELTMDDIGEFIADSLKLTVEEVEPLTEAIFTKTMGSPFFTRQALEQLVRKNALYYDTISFQWSWNLPPKQLEDLMSDDLVEMVKSKIDNLQPDLQEVLIVASYVGRSNFDVDTLLVLMHPELQQQQQESSKRSLSRRSSSKKFIHAASHDFETEKKGNLITLLDQAVMEGLLLHSLKTSPTTKTLTTATQSNASVIKTANTTIPNNIGESTTTQSNNSLPRSPMDTQHRQHSGSSRKQQQQDNYYYSFAHDRIQEAARGLVASKEEEEDALLLRIGNALYRRALCSSQGEDWMFFVAAQHLNKVSSSLSSAVSLTRENGEKEIQDDKEKENEDAFQLSCLNERTAELSLELLAFPAAADFVKHGIANLPEDEEERWSSDHFRLTLKLYSAGAEAELGLGHAGEAEEYCRKVLCRRERKSCSKESANNTQTPSIRDVLPVYRVLQHILSGKGEKIKTHELNVEILEELGVKFPKSKQMQKIRSGLYLKQVKARYIPTEESIRNMPHVTDQLTIDTMEFLQKGGAAAYGAEDVPMYVLLCCESIRWMSQHGLTDMSACTLASFANILMHVYGDFDTSSRLAELAIMIADRLQNKFNEPRALNTASFHVLGWVRPVRSQIQYHIRAHDSGLMSGNIEGGFIGRQCLHLAQLLSSAPLKDAEADLRESIPKMIQMGLTFNANLSCVYWQFTLNLLGFPGNDHTTKLTGEAMDESDEVYGKMPAKNLFQAFRSYAFMIFGEFEAGADDALERGESFAKVLLGILYGMETFWRAMPLMVMAQRKATENPKRRIYKKEGLKLLKCLKNWVKNGCVNLAGPTRLLQGEEAVMLGKTKVAKAAFQDAVEICTRGEFHQYAGLANERYAAYLQELGDLEGARTKLSEAIMCYGRWGARRKVEILQNQMSAM